MDWLDQVLAVERAWALAGEAEAAGPTALDRLREAAVLGAGSPQVLVRIAGVLAAWNRAEEARDLLAGGLADGPPPAPLQIAYARQLRGLSDMDGARRWYRGAMLRARPDASLMLELAEIDDDPRLVEAAAALRCDDAAGMAARATLHGAQGADRLAAAAYRIAYARGWREDGFLAGYDAFLAASGREVDQVTMVAAHRSLALRQDRAGLLAATRAREASPQWIGLDALAPFLADRIAAREPFSWIRLGDGEARFLLAADASLGHLLTERERRAAGRVMWDSWFGERLDDVPADQLATLAGQLRTAAANADLLGIASTPRLEHDPDHFGWCAALDGWVRQVATRPGQRFTEALFNYPLNEADPLLARLLSGAGFLGVISPHRGLAARLAERLGIPRHVEHLVPGEHRSRLRGDGGRHYPDRFEQLMAELVVPHRGALFLVAGGLLGKLYCDRIRTLGGIALDIGALADVWMGHNTRGSSLEKALRHTLV